MLNRKYKERERGEGRVGGEYITKVELTKKKKEIHLFIEEKDIDPFYLTYITTR